MKKLYPFLFVLATPVVLFLMSSSSGSPGGKSGSPGDDNATCTQCHTGAATAVPGWITTDIPAEGYTPGETYTITATGTHTGVEKFGFELTVEDSDGLKTGTLQIAEAARTKLVNASKAVTHTATGNVPSGNSITWTVNWVAPSGVEGPVGIYAAFNAANGNGNTGGDVIYTSELFVSEMATSIADLNNQTPAIYPNPASHYFYLDHAKGHDLYVYNAEGRNILRLTNADEKQYVDISGLSDGLYFIKLVAADSREQKIQKLIVN